MLLCMTLMGVSHPGRIDGVAIPMPLSRVEITEIYQWQRLRTDYTTHLTELLLENCVVLRNLSSEPVVRAEFVLALAGKDGKVLDSFTADTKRGIAANGTASPPCVFGGYGFSRHDGTLVGWVTSVSYADGTSWRAPAPEQMTPFILDAISKHE